MRSDSANPQLSASLRLGPPKVFISHTTADDAAVAELATQLRAGGIEVFNDAWEVQAGKDFVAWINERLDACDAGILVFSPRTVGKPWVDAEISALIYMRVTEGKQLIPVLIEDGESPLRLPPLLRPLSRRGIGQVQAILDLLLDPIAPPPLGKMGDAMVHRVHVSLQRRAATEAQAGALTVDVALDGRGLASTTTDKLPAAIVEGRRRFLEGFHHATARSPMKAERETREHSLDAVEEARRLEQVEVRILEVGSPEEIGKAFAKDAYHILYLTCHGSPGSLLLEDELGGELKTTPADLVAPIVNQGSPPAAGDSQCLPHGRR